MKLFKRMNLLRFDDRPLLIISGMMAGALSGLAAFGLNKSLEFLMELFQSVRSSWWAFALPAAGACLSSLFLVKVAREEKGHGIPEVIYSVSKYGGKLKFRSCFSRLISSCLTIGTGGSAGPESPVVFSGSAIGSNIAQLFSFNERQRITLVGCGAAGAIASIFNAPIAGMVFVLEVVLGEWSAVNIVPIAVAAVAGTEVSRQLSGNQIAFSHHVFTISFHDIIASAGLALFTSLISILLTRFIRGQHHIADKINIPFWVKAAIGGCAVGLLGVFVPDVLGEGYPAIRQIIEGAYHNGTTFVLIACFAKVVATSLTLGWGGSGGIFAPSLVAGSLAGLGYHRILVHAFPSVSWVGEGCFALLGMAGLVGGILQAPLTGIFLIVEITGSYEVILPLIVISSLSSTICYYFEPASLYMRELMERRHVLRPGTDARVLSDLRVPELLEKSCTVISPTMSMGELVRIIAHSSRNFYPVEHPETKQFLGLVKFDDIRPYLFEPLMYDMVFVEQIMDSDVKVVHMDDDLADVLRLMDTQNLSSIPVVEGGQFKGMISKATLLDQYRKELMVQTGHF